MGWSAGKAALSRDMAWCVAGRAPLRAARKLRAPKKAPLTFRM
jgi:hypothetical protein